MEKEEEKEHFLLPMWSWSFLVVLVPAFVIHKPFYTESLLLH